MLGCSDVIFQKCFPNQGTKLYPDDPTELGFVLQRKYEVVKLFAFQADVLLHVHLVINLVFGGILVICVQVFSVNLAVLQLFLAC